MRWDYEMSIGKIKGANAHGHLGWVTVRCRICARLEDYTRAVIYVCPECMKKIPAYYCSSCAKVLHYKCPYCKTPLVTLSSFLSGK